MSCNWFASEDHQGAVKPYRVKGEHMGPKLLHYCSRHVERVKDFAIENLNEDGSAKSTFHQLNVSACLPQ